MVRRANTSRLEFEAAAVYEYPEHLRPWLDDLHKKSGVYVFHSDSYKILCKLMLSGEYEVIELE